MRIKMTLPNADAERLRSRVLGSAEAVERDDTSGDQWEVVRSAFSVLDALSSLDTGSLDRPWPVPCAQ